MSCSMHSITSSQRSSSLNSEGMTFFNSEKLVFPSRIVRSSAARYPSLSAFKRCLLKVLLFLANGVVALFISPPNSSLALLEASWTLLVAWFVATIAPWLVTTTLTILSTVSATSRGMVGASLVVPATSLIGTIATRKEDSSWHHCLY